jgi:predicted thioesterase
MDRILAMKVSTDHVVSGMDTAAELGSGTVPVLGTPRLLEWMESATVQALDRHLDEGESSVGSLVCLRHTRASPIGSDVSVSAKITERKGRQVKLAVVAHTADGTVLAEGMIRRVVVDTSRFLRDL